jgi:hypothetical protein
MSKQCFIQMNLTLAASPLNLPGPGCDQEQASSRGGKSLRGQTFMKSIQPDKTDPIPLRPSPPGMGTILIRFVGLLFVAVVALALAWSR